MNFFPFTTVFFLTLFSPLFFTALIRFSEKHGLVDIPSSRRKHKKPTPITGGVGIFAIWLLGVCSYSFLQPSWFLQHTTSILVLSVVILGLLTVGLLDDLKGLSPKVKLSAEFLLAFVVLKYEPQVHEACWGVISSAPVWAQPVLWLLGAIWIVGAANAVNLVDGIDGFAGGVSLLAIVTVVLLHGFSGGSNTFMPVVLLLCLPGLLGFLFHNWHPAKIFLGDNGSLTLGFLIATGGLIPTAPENALTSVGSLLILLAYPVLDMTLCVIRRFRSGYPIFKADRSHLHHRLQRLGLSVPQTTVLLLCAFGYFQFSALLVHLVHSRLALLITCSSALGLFSLLYLILCMESWKRKNLLAGATNSKNMDISNMVNLETFSSFIEIDLKPLLEVGLLEEKNGAEQIVNSLVLMLKRNIRATDLLSVRGQKLHIYLEGGNKSWNNRAIVERRIRGELLAFQRMFHLQYSIDGLPLEAKETNFPAASA